MGVMFSELPDNAAAFMGWSWKQVEPFFASLEKQVVEEGNVAEWLSNWSELTALVHESLARLNVARTLDTSDSAAEERYFDFLEEILPGFHAAEDRLKQKLVGSKLTPEGMAIPILKMTAEIEAFSEANLPLLTDERKVYAAYDKIIGGQTVRWRGEELTLAQLKPLYQTPERGVREQIWRLASSRQLQDRADVNEKWRVLLGLRGKMAANAGFDGFLSYRWKSLHRFDYSPEDCRTFRHAIEEVVVPAATRVYGQIKKEFGVESIRPWDVQADINPLSLPALKPYSDEAELRRKAAAIFQTVDPQLGRYFEVMREEDLLDLFNRRGKAAGGYCTSYPVVGRPFIFMNGVGTADDVRTILHEAGHAFHVFESSALPYVFQRRAGAEFAEVASMSMELLSSPYLSRRHGGFYEEQDANSHRINHLRKIITFWPYMAVVDGFQHWAYENLSAALDPANCDSKWAVLWHRFIPGVDFSGLETEMETGWQRKLHIFRYPFYYVEYGLAQLGAIQVWRNAMDDQDESVSRYRSALALGGTRSLPELYAAAGASFAFDTVALRDVVSLIEASLESLLSDQTSE